MLLTTSGSRMAITFYYPHVVVKNGNFTLQLTSSHQELLLTSSGQAMAMVTLLLDM